MEYKTKNFKLPLLSTHQANKEATHNEAINLVDFFLDKSVTSIEAALPENPQNGDVYLIIDSNSAYHNHVVLFDNSWKAIDPVENMVLYIKNEGKKYIFKNVQWIEFVENSGSAISPHISSDNYNNVIITGNESLFASENGDVRVNLNKQNQQNTASFIFKNSWQGHAEFGLIGDNNFSLKISSDGQNFIQSMVVNSQTGLVDFKAGVTNNGVKIGAFGNEYQVAMDVVYQASHDLVCYGVLDFTNSSGVAFVEVKTGDNVGAIINLIASIGGDNDGINQFKSISVPIKSGKYYTISARRVSGVGSISTSLYTLEV